MAQLQSMYSFQALRNGYITDFSGVLWLTSRRAVARSEIPQYPTVTSGITYLHNNWLCAFWLSIHGVQWSKSRPGPLPWTEDCSQWTQWVGSCDLPPGPQLVICKLVLNGRTCVWIYMRIFLTLILDYLCNKRIYIMDIYHMWRRNIRLSVRPNDQLGPRG